MSCVFNNFNIWLNTLYHLQYLGSMWFTQIVHRSASDLDALNKGLTLQFCKSPCVPSAGSQHDSEQRLITLIIYSLSLQYFCYSKRRTMLTWLTFKWVNLYNYKKLYYKWLTLLSDFLLLHTCSYFISGWMLADASRTMIVFPDWCL